jgi:hypothetical protein
MPRISSPLLFHAGLPNSVTQFHSNPYNQPGSPLSPCCFVVRLPSWFLLLFRQPGPSPYFKFGVRALPVFPQCYTTVFSPSSSLPSSANSILPLSSMTSSIARFVRRFTCVAHALHLFRFLRVFLSAGFLSYVRCSIQKSLSRFSVETGADGFKFGAAEPASGTGPSQPRTSSRSSSRGADG